MTYHIVVLPGDGIGPEVTREAMTVLTTIGRVFGHDFQFTKHPIGGAAIDTHDHPFPKETQRACLAGDAVFLGAIGGPKWDTARIRPEDGLLALRKTMGVFANVRPVQPQPRLQHLSPMKPAVLEGTDLIVVRELTGGIYFGKKQRSEDCAVDECVYSKSEIERITRVACSIAKKRRGQVNSVDKANVLETSRLWRTTVTDVIEREFPDIHLEHLLVDAAAMHLVQRPSSFDVILTENMFGDILTDLASVLPGSIGLLPSASLGEAGPGLFEPIHGSAPDIAGQGVANPYGAILSAAMLLRDGLGLETEAAAVERAVFSALEQGKFTRDLNPDNFVSTQEAGAAVTASITQEWYTGVCS